MPRTEEEWRRILTPEQYRVMRAKGTDLPFAGKYVNHKEEGVYACAGCGAKLFESTKKFESASGWPSFSEAAKDDSVKVSDDYSHGMSRRAISCAGCGSHLGHVFDDGPKPGRMRYCVNSTALDFLPSAKKRS